MTSIKGLDAYFNSAIKCPICGHSTHFLRTNKVICNWCGNYVFKNKKVEFEHKLKCKRSTLKNEQATS